MVCLKNKIYSNEESVVYSDMSFLFHWLFPQISLYQRIMVTGWARCVVIWLPQVTQPENSKSGIQTQAVLLHSLHSASVYAVSFLYLSSPI